MGCCGVKASSNPAQSLMKTDQTPKDSAEASQPFELNGINVSFESNQLTAVVGHVGCGKSSLLNAILGEMPKYDDSMELNNMVHIKGTIGYVPQTPFIMNASLRDNILFGSPFDEEKYNVGPFQTEYWIESLGSLLASPRYRYSSCWRHDRNRRKGNQSLRRTENANFAGSCRLSELRHVIPSIHFNV